MKQRLDTSDNSSTCDGCPDLEFNAGKRKCIAKDVHSVSSSSPGRDTKIGKVADDTKEDDSNGKVEDCNHSQAGESSPKEIKDNAKPSHVSAKQDYIHVRARRGQATDSHSLAERVRREKISARMKLLQELVPGCSKITGKAVMLDEIINYVQSLQRQVEFLSMKLAAVSPGLDFTLEGRNPAKDSQMLQPPCSFANKPCSPESTAAYPHLQKSHMQLLFAPHAEGAVVGSLVPHAEVPVVGNVAEIAVGRTRTAELLVTNVCEDPMFKISNAGDDELQSAFPLVLEQNSYTHFTSQRVHGSLTTDHLKVVH